MVRFLSVQGVRRVPRGGCGYSVQVGPTIRQKKPLRAGNEVDNPRCRFFPPTPPREQGGEKETSREAPVCHPACFAEYPSLLASRIGVRYSDPTGILRY